MIVKVGSLRNEVMGFCDCCSDPDLHGILPPNPTFALLVVLLNIVKTENEPLEEVICVFPDVLGILFCESLQQVERRVPALSRSYSAAVVEDNSWDSTCEEENCTSRRKQTCELGVSKVQTTQDLCSYLSTEKSRINNVTMQHMICESKGNLRDRVDETSSPLVNHAHSCTAQVSRVALRGAETLAATP